MASRSSLRKKNEYEGYLSSTPSKFEHHDRGDRKYESASEETMASYENKLPLNLFYSSAEYNKMLITNGKSVQKKSESAIEGFINDLEFINKPIFLSCENRKEMLKKKYKAESTSPVEKQINYYTEDLCCCCDEACQICVKEQQKKIKNKLSNYELERALENINKKPIKSRSMSNRIKKIINSETEIKSKVQDFNHNQLYIGGTSDKEASSSYLSQKSFQIDHLICNSLIKFEESKREEKLKVLIEKQKKEEQRNLLKQMDEDIRLNNKETIERSRSRNGNKSLNSKSVKNDLHIKYWESVRDTIAQSLRKDKISKPKEIEKISKSSVDCEHKPKISPDKMKELAKKHEEEALLKIENEARENEKRKKEKEKKLKELEKNRMEHIEGCSKKKFKPTPKMIEEAFKNIIEEKNLVKNNAKIISRSKAKKSDKKL